MMERPYLIRDFDAVELALIQRGRLPEAKRRWHERNAPQPLKEIPCHWRAFIASIVLVYVAMIAFFIWLNVR